MKKGFTLIELLAVIVILAIIALIAIPQITNIVDNAKKEAGARSVEGHIESINTELSKKLLLNNDLSDGEYSLNSLDVKTKGNTTCTSYTIKSNTILSASSCEANGYTYSYNMENGAYILAGSKGSNANIYAKYNGRLHVTGSKLMNSKKQEFRLTGMGVETNFEKYPYLIKEESIASIKTWGINTFRIFIDGAKRYQSHYNYIGNEEKYLNYVYTAIDNAIKNDMYVVINWNPSGPDPLLNDATNLFTKITNKYPNDYHILYEIWNEADGTQSWTRIKEYANQIIPVIRKASPDAIVFVASPNNCSRVDQVIGNELKIPNIMYTYHMYPNGMSDTNYEKLENALQKGLPIFVSEWAAGRYDEKVDQIKEAHATAFAKLFAKYNLSYAYFSFASSDYAFAIVKDKQWDDKLPDEILLKNGKFLKKILNNNYEYNVNLMKWNSSSDSSKAHSYRSNEWKDKIISIEFKNKLNVPSNAVITWDLSRVQDKSIIGYLVPSEEQDMYKMIIAANGKINAPMYSDYLFAGMTNLKTIDFTNFVTDEVVSVSQMFRGDTNLLDLDLSGFNASRINNISGLCAFCNNVQNINLQNWNAKVSSIRGAFEGCKKLKTIDLSGIDVSNVTDFGYIFNVDINLQEVNLSTWKPKQVVLFRGVFNACRDLKTVDISGFDFTSETDVTNSLSEVGNTSKSTKIIVKDQNIVDKLKPIATNYVSFEIKK